MKGLGDDLYLLRGFPPNAINVYLAGDVLVDAGTRHAGRRILDQLSGRTVNAHALTHAHPDHQGASHQVCEALGIPLWCGELDADAVESGNVVAGDGAVNGLIRRIWPGPAHPVAQRLKEGDTVAGFTVLDTPGHSAGHISYWRESDRTLICGDVFFGLNMLTGIPGLHEPPAPFTPDVPRNRESMRRLAALEPRLVCFGHGPSLRDPAKLSAFVSTLPG
jgi:glyoxylase-like metal-dependent hydrolase (beta-lactamase superfamily II)